MASKKAQKNVLPATGTKADKVAGATSRSASAAKSTAAALAAAHVLQLERDLKDRISELAKAGEDFGSPKSTETIERQITALIEDPAELDRAVRALSAALRAIDGSDPDARASTVWRTWVATVELIRDQGELPDDAATVAVTMVVGTSGFSDIDRSLFKKAHALSDLARSADAYVNGPRVGQASRWRGFFDTFAHAAGASDDATKRMKPRKMPA